MQAVAAVVVRNSQGKLVDDTSSFLQALPPLAGEGFALLKAMKIAIRKQAVNIILDIHSLIL